MRDDYNTASKQVIVEFCAALKDSVQDMPVEMLNSLELLEDSLVRNNRALRNRVQEVFAQIDLAKDSRRLVNQRF